MFLKLADETDANDDVDVRTDVLNRRCLSRFLSMEKITSSFSGPSTDSSCQRRDSKEPQQRVASELLPPVGDTANVTMMFEPVVDSLVICLCCATANKVDDDDDAEQNVTQQRRPRIVPTDVFWFLFIVPMTSLSEL